jgi:hypothetical protein
MGQLIYGTTGTTFVVEDRTLAHLEMVILAKLRRNEGFALSLENGAGGRTSMWLGAQAHLLFVFDEPRTEINREWLERLVDSANSPSGLSVLAE